MPAALCPDCGIYWCVFCYGMHCPRCGSNLIQGKANSRNAEKLNPKFIMKIRVTVLQCTPYDLTGQDGRQYIGWVVNGFTTPSKIFPKGVVRFSSQKEYGSNEEAIGYDEKNSHEVSLRAKIFGDKVTYTETEAEEP